MTQSLDFSNLQLRLEELVASPGVFVLRAPPGSGKTRAVVHAVHDLLRRRQVRRVLFATHSTLGDDAHAREIEEAFRRLRRRARVLLGRAHFPDVASYEAQFEDSWRGVRIIAHAHLPVMFEARSSRVSSFLRAADLLVIDEDPLNALLRSSEPGELTEDALPVLTCAGIALGNPLDAFFKAVVNVWLAVQRGELRDRTVSWDSSGLGGTPDRATLTGEGFWSAVLEHAPQPAWAEVERSLQRLNGAYRAAGEETRLPVRWLLDALIEDFDAARAGRFSQRFGLTWQGEPLFAEFRFDVRVTMDVPCPVLVLDAYADEALYDAIFAPHPVVFLREFDAVTPLRIEVASEKALNVRDFEDPRRMRVVRAQLARVVAEVTSSGNPGTLVLGSKDMHQNGHAWHDMLTRVLHDSDVAERVETFHWWAGRGKNAWTGRHVVALTPPWRPRFFQEHVLAALFPYDAVLRAAANKRLRHSELLQMLHRGRQPRFQDDPPRVVTFFPVDLPAKYWKAVPFRSAVTLEKHQQFTAIRDAIRAIAVELVVLLGCVPIAVLEALGLLVERSGEGERNERIRHALRRRVKRKITPELYHWCQHGRFKTFQVTASGDPCDVGVRKFRSNDRTPVYEVLNSLGLQRRNFGRIENAECVMVASVVFVQEELEADAVKGTLRALLTKIPLESAARWECSAENAEVACNPSKTA